MYSHTYGSGTRITRPSEEPARVARSKDTQSPPSHWKTYYQTQLGLVLKVNSVWKPSGAGVDPRTERNEATRSADDVRHPNSSVHPLYISSVIQPRSFSVEAKKCITRSRALKALKGQSDRSGTQSSDDQGGSGDRDESTPSSDGGQQVRLEVKLLQRTPGGRRSPSPRSSYTDLGQQSPNTPRPTSLVPLSLPETGRISPSPKQAKPHHPSTWLEPLSGRQDGKHPTGDKTINERNLQWNKQLQDDFGISHWPASASDVLTKHRRGSSREVSSEGKPSLEPLDHSHHDKFQSVHDKLFRHKNTTDSRKGKEHNSGNSKDGKVTHTEDSEDSALGSEKRDEPCETTTKENSPTGTRDSKTADKDMVPTASPMRGRLKYTVCPQGASANLPPNNQLLKTLSNAQLDARLTARTSSSSTSASLRIHLSVPAVPPDEDKEASPSGEPHTQSVAHSSEDGTTSTAGGKHHTRYRQFWKRGSRQGKDGSRDRHSRGSRSVEVTSADTVESSLSDAGTTTLAQSCLKDGRLARQVEKSLERRLARRMVRISPVGRNPCMLFSSLEKSPPRGVIFNYQAVRYLVISAYASFFGKTTSTEPQVIAVWWTRPHLERCAYLSSGLNC